MKIKYLVVIAVLATAVLGFGFGAKAQTADVSALIAQLQAQIQSLMQQLAQLQAQQGATIAWCHTFNANLRVGDSAGDVQHLGTALKKEGLEAGTATSEGAGYYFNEQTASAVVGFQEKYASEILTPNELKHGTGYVGPATRAKLNALYGCGITPALHSPQLLLLLLRQTEEKNGFKDKHTI